MKAVKIIALTLLLTLLLSLCAFAEGGGTMVDEQLEKSGANALAESLDGETRGLLSRLGIDGIDFSAIFNASPRDIVKLITDIFRGRMKEPLKMLMKAAGVIIMLSCAGSFFTQGDKSGSIINIASGVFLTISIAAPISKVLTSAVAAVMTSSTFMLAMIPVLAAIIVSSGNPMLAVCYNSMAFAAAQGVSQIASRLMTPCCGLLTGIAVIDSIVPDLKLQKVADFIKKTAIWIFASAATLFTALLSLKGILASSADTLAAKGIKLAISSFIPVIGSQLSDAYASVVGSLSIVRAAVGAFGIAAVLLINLPVVAELTLWTGALKLSALCADMMDLKNVTGFLKTVSGALVLMNVCVIFNAALMVITTGIMIAIKG
ncbi:MAG: stage III sporulation protein AE [Oscillospiraceae bacterium]|nr:stage III sporulation protein AE [Oscillospiraceae bacterium]